MGRGLPLASTAKPEVSSRSAIAYLPTSVVSSVKVATPALKVSVRLFDPGAALGSAVPAMLGAAPPGSAVSRTTQAFSPLLPS